MGGGGWHRSFALAVSSTWTMLSLKDALHNARGTVVGSDRDAFARWAYRSHRSRLVATDAWHTLSHSRNSACVDTRADKDRRLRGHTPHMAWTAATERQRGADAFQV